MPSDDLLRLRTSSSVDELFALVEELDEDQLHVLLQDLNSTPDRNVPVAHAIDFFEQPKSRFPGSGRRTFRSPPPAAATDPPASPLSSSSSSSSSPLSSSPPSPPRRAFPSFSARRDSNTTTTTNKRVFSAPQPALAPAPAQQRPKSATSPPEQRRAAYRAYRRISRPPLPSPAAASGLDLHALLAAHLFDLPLPESARSGPRSATGGIGARGFAVAEQQRRGQQPESIGIDLLEPEAARGLLGLGRPAPGAPSAVSHMDSIFQVLDVRKE